MSRQPVVLLGGPDWVQREVKDRDWTFNTETMKHIILDKIIFGSNEDAAKLEGARFDRTDEVQGGKVVYRYVSE